MSLFEQLGVDDDSNEGSESSSCDEDEHKRDLRSNFVSAFLKRVNERDEMLYSIHTPVLVAASNTICLTVVSCIVKHHKKNVVFEALYLCIIPSTYYMIQKSFETHCVLF